MLTKLARQLGAAVLDLRMPFARSTHQLRAAQDKVAQRVGQGFLLSQVQLRGPCAAGQCFVLGVEPLISAQARVERSDTRQQCGMRAAQGGRVDHLLQVIDGRPCATQTLHRHVQGKRQRVVVHCHIGAARVGQRSLGLGQQQVKRAGDVFGSDRGEIQGLGV